MTDQHNKDAYVLGILDTLGYALDELEAEPEENEAAIQKLRGIYHRIYATRLDSFRNFLEGKEND